MKDQDAENSGKTAPRGRPFPPGHSGNPGGRPVKSPQEIAIAEAARAHTGEALEVVVGLMRRAKTPRVKLAAALAVIERGCGKPGDTIAAAINLPAGASLAEQARAIIGAATTGALAIPHATALLAALGHVSRLVEVDELARRLAELEERLGAQGGPK